MTRTLLHVFATFKVGGPQIRFARVANHFGRRWRHLVVAMDGNTEARERLDPGLDVEFPEIAIRRGRTLPNLMPFRRALKAWRPDLLVTSNWGSIDWALANLDGLVPHLHMEDGFGPEEALRQLPRRVWTRRLALRRSTVLLPSMTLQRIARTEWKLPARRILYVPNGVDCARFVAMPPETTGGAMAGPVVGTVAVLRPEKNLKRLLEAFALVARERPARLEIVGDGPERAALEAYASDLGVAGRVTFAGNRSDPERALAGFSVFALSSDTEQMPLSVLEAMAAGRPLVATDVGDVRRMVAQENHPFVVPKDARMLAGALRTLLDRPGMAAEIGAANARRAREVYDEELMFSAFAKLFDRT